MYREVCSYYEEYIIAMLYVLPKPREFYPKWLAGDLRNNRFETSWFKRGEMRYHIQ